uniref:Uncharacterized protein n=1 Tax=Sphaerodactylus townsendi TaxID=933632 RepID=A0ACB8ER36_9SAUR
MGWRPGPAARAVKYQPCKGAEAGFGLADARGALQPEAYGDHLAPRGKNPSRENRTIAAGLRRATGARLATCSN